MDYVVIKPKLLALPSANEAEAIAKVREDFVNLIRGSDVVVDVEETDTPAGVAEAQKHQEMSGSAPSDTWLPLTPVEQAAAACVNEPRGLWGETIKDLWRRRPTPTEFQEVISSVADMKEAQAASDALDAHAEAAMAKPESDTSAIAEAGGVGDELPF